VALFTSNLGLQYHRSRHELGALPQGTQDHQAGNGRIGLTAGSCVNSLIAVPIRQIYECWVSKFAEHWATTLIGLKESLAGKSDQAEKRSQTKK
jgi:hypothetical protein